MALSRDEVVITAVKLLNEVGLDGLTLRRLGKQLGVSAPTLYWHVRDKRELLDLMAEHMRSAQLSKMPPIAADLDWAEKIEEGLRRQYQAIIAYRDGARVVAGNRPTESALPMIEHYLKMWLDAGFPADEALATILTLGDFITGSALEYQSEKDRTDHRSGQRMENWRQIISQYPALQSATRNRSRDRGRSNFEIGLKLMMAGIRARHAELRAEKPAADHKKAGQQGPA